MISLVQQSSSKYKQFLKEKQEREKTEAELKKKNEITKQLNFYKKEKQQKEKSYTALAEQSKAAFLEASSESDMKKITVGWQRASMINLKK